jgi:outer membrane protein assembly factor BamB
VIVWKALVMASLTVLGCANSHPNVIARAPLPRAAVAPERTAMPEGVERDWPMFRDDVERSGFAEGSSVGTSVELLWQMPKFNLTRYGAAKGSPSVVGDMLYCGTDTGRFIAARIDDGSVVWQIQFDHTTHGIHGSPAIVGDFVYIGAYDGTLYAFERRTGLLVWRYRLGYQVGSSPAVVPRWGLIFSSHEESANGGGFVVALDARTGALVWQQRTAAHPHSSVAVDISRNLVFVGDNRGIIYAFDSHSGRPRWQLELDHTDGKADVKTTPMVIPERGQLVFGAWSGKVYSVDELTGHVVWEHPTGGKLMGSAAYLPASGTIYEGSPQGSLFAIDAATGTTRWSFSVGARIVSSPAVSGDGRAVVFGASDGNVYAVDATLGRLIWTFHVGGQVSGSPTLVGDKIYVTSHGGGLWALVSRS